MVFELYTNVEVGDRIRTRSVMHSLSTLLVNLSGPGALSDCIFLERLPDLFFCGFLWDIDDR